MLISHRRSLPHKPAAGTGSWPVLGLYKRVARGEIKQDKPLTLEKTED